MVRAGAGGAVRSTWIERLREAELSLPAASNADTR